MRARAYVRLTHRHEILSFHHTAARHAVGGACSKALKHRKAVLAGWGGVGAPRHRQALPARWGGGEGRVLRQGVWGSFRAERPGWRWDAEKDGWAVLMAGWMSRLAVGCGEGRLGGSDGRLDGMRRRTAGRF
eukprot:360468-Chlamydomonas_euryale.AAC.6